MKKVITLILLSFLVFSNAEAKKLTALLSYATFYSPADGSYIETYLAVDGNSVNYAQNENGDFQAAIEVTFLFKQGDKIVDFEKIELMGTPVKDTTLQTPGLLDQRRFSLPNGDYDFVIKISDKNSNAKPFVNSQPIEINYNNNDIAFSDVEMVNSYSKTEKENILSKSGYDVIPYPSNFYNNSKDKFTFYSELYNTDKQMGENSDFLIKYYIKSYNTNEVLENFTRVKRLKAKPVHVIFHEFDIASLPSGNYFLMIETYDKNNQLKAKKELFFQRSNPDLKLEVKDFVDTEITNSFVDKITNKKLILSYIKSTTPTATRMELMFIHNEIEKQDIDILKRFFYSFWLKRNPTNPELEWDEYFAQVKIADEKFGTTVKRGYTTDRGRVFLKYGAPNTIVKSDNITTIYPYEIWHYYQLKQFRNKKFVFTALNRATNMYYLLHSDVPGEINDRQWKAKLNMGIQPTNVDDEGGNNKEIYGTQKDVYDMPY
ncbi:MAG: GWxTD domain-containing protein [Bacteroidota bacterium]|nr:GWxTD domain-containing protein [Bacteroidota bacterium]